MWEQEVGERIGQLRKERNLSREKFGAMTGLSVRYIGSIERGRHNITGATIAKICSAVGVSSDYILFGSLDTTAMISALHGLSHEQIQVIFDISMQVIKFLGTKNGNNALIQEALRRQYPEVS